MNASMKWIVFIGMRKHIDYDFFIGNATTNANIEYSISINGIPLGWVNH